MGVNLNKENMYNMRKNMDIINKFPVYSACLRIVIEIKIRNKQGC